MAVELFTRQEFERALPGARLVGCHGHEYVYAVGTSHPRVSIRVHSSVNVRTGRADGTGENSIRMYLYLEDAGRSLGKDGTEYTTRVKGWQARLGDKIAALRARVRKCPECGGVGIVRAVRKEGPNRGRRFWSCVDRGCWGGWVEK